MSIEHWAVPHGIMGRSTLASDTPAQVKYGCYIDPTTGVETNEGNRMVRLYNNTGAATVQGGVYQVTWGATEATLVQVIAGAATTVDVEMVVAEGVVAIGAWGWFFWGGMCPALVEGTTDVSVADFLKFVTGTSSNGFIKDGTARTGKSFAIAYAAQAANSAVLTKVFLLGGRADAD